MPQSEPAAATKRLGFPHVLGEDARRQSLRHVVVAGDRLGEIVAQHVEDRREGLVAHDRALRRHLDQRRLDVMRRRDTCRQHAAAAGDRPPSSFACASAAACARSAASISGPTSVPASQRIADRQAARRPLQRRHAACRGSSSWTKSRRSEVQRCPAVPTAENRIARSRHAEFRRRARRSSRCCRRARGWRGRNAAPLRAERAAHARSNRWR